MDHRELRVNQLAFESAVRIFELTKTFPPEERYSLTDQIRRSSRSVCANIAEAWRKRRYPNNFVSKLSDADAEATETLVWLDFALNTLIAPHFTLHPPRLCQLSPTPKPSTTPCAKR
ncbi:MAG TPA: four helix bundle protein [Anaerolineales bacterium]|nr:four helix bundle protein [Anaerolineales bacterium]HLB45396.1 four helix bundle protein [Anaerolineales bacterium]